MFARFPQPLRPLTLKARREIEAEVYDELRAYLAISEEEKVASGMTAEKARDEARRELGDAEGIADACVRIQDEHPMRMTVRAFEATVTLTVGIGLAAALFLLVNAVFYRTPVSFHDEARRVAIWWHDTATGRLSSGSTYGEFLSLRDLDDVFEHTTLGSYMTVNAGIEGLSESVRVKYVSRGYFRLYGAEPLLGRVFADDEVEERARPVALLAHDLWKGSFDGDREVLGRTIEIDGKPHEIVGVMPADLQMYKDTAVYLPMAAHRSDGSGPRFANRLAAARLREGVSLDEAQARVGRTVDGLREENPARYAELEPRLRPLERVYAHEVEGRVLGGLVIMGLFLASVLAHVLYRRSAAARLAAGSREWESGSRWRLAGSFAENVLVVSVAAAAGLLVARLAAAKMAVPFMGDLARLFDVRQDARVLLLAVAVGVGVAFVPRLLSKMSRATSLFVGVEVALAFLLVLAAAPTVRMQLAGVSASPGFDPEGLVTIDVSAFSVQDARERSALFSRMKRRIESLPEVEQVSFTHAYPMLGRYWGHEMAPEDRAGDRHPGLLAVVDEDFHAVAGIRIVEGRGLHESTEREGAVINRAMAERLWPDGDAIGSRIRVGSAEKSVEVIGIAANVRQDAPHRRERAIVYRSFRHFPGAGKVTFVVRTSGDPEAVGAAALEALRAEAPALPYGAPLTGDAILRGAASGLRFYFWFMSAVAVLALALALADLWRLAQQGAGRLHDPAILVSLAGLAAAGLLVWRIGPAGVPVLSRLSSIEPWTTAVAVGLFTLALGSVIFGVSRYVRSIEPVAGLQDG